MRDIAAFEEIALATLSGTRHDCLQTLAGIPLHIVDDLGMRKPLVSAAEDLLELMMRRYERASTIVTSNRPLEDWPAIFGDAPAVAAFLDRMMHHSHLIQIKDKSYRLHESAAAHKLRENNSLKTTT